MFSNENPPPDPSCSTAHHDQNHVNSYIPSLSELDLHPNFSIRDYVLNARSKDIKTNWPFSETNLQLCLKHGVKNLLPPFKNIDSAKICPLKTCLPRNTEKIGNSDRTPSDIQSVHTNITPSSAIETVNPSKIDNNTPFSNKKSRLIVKFGTITNPSSTEDIVSNSTTLSEAMTSNTCPVCKAFSSSSNTTLNAHIDQCLSEGPTFKLTTEDSTRFIPSLRCRAKPRKMRLMSDIMVTAPRCTLEELDRRNGTSWAATGSALTIQRADDKVFAVQGKKQRPSPVCLGDEGEVYVDANGTKLRILSKLNIASSTSQIGVNPHQREGIKVGGKGTKFVSLNKKNHHALKHQKYLNLTLPNKNISSPKTRTSQIHEDQDGDYGVKEVHCNEAQLTDDFGAQGNSIEPSHSGNLRQWVCSKRTSFSKKFKTKEINEHLECTLNMAHDMLAENDQSSLGESHITKNHAERFPNYIQTHSITKKKVQRLSTEDQMVEDVEKSCGPLSHNSLKYSRNDNSMRDNFLPRPLKRKKDHASFLGKKKHKTSGESSNVSTYPSRDCQRFSSNGIKLPSFKKKLITLSQSSVPEAKIYPKLKNTSNFKKCKARYTEEMDEEYYDSIPDHTENEFRKVVAVKRSLGRSSSINENMLKRGEMNHTFPDEFDGLESARKVSEFYKKDNFYEQSFRLEFAKVDYSSETQSDSMQSAGAYKAHKLSESESPLSSADPSLENGRDMFCMNGLIGDEADVEMEMGSSKLSQMNNFHEIEPIPIPGPPGSFLPSPRDMGSDDFQGNSSLINSSQDPHYLANEHSSDSPISGTSIVSNSTVKDKTQYAISGASIESVVENVPRQPLTTNTDSDRSIITDLKSLKINTALTPKSGPLMFEDNSSQPCCCARKERLSQGFLLNYQDSQLLRRRNMVLNTINDSNSAPEKAILPGLTPWKCSYDTNNVKFPARCDYDSPSPSASTPILRLMGKNLMVVNQDENSTHVLKEFQADNNPYKNILNPKFLNFSGTSPASYQNWDYRSSGDIIVSQDSANMGRGFDARFSNSLRGHLNYETLQPPDPIPGSANTYLSNQIHGPSSFGELQVAHDTFFHVPRSKQADTGPVYWTRPSDGSNKLQHGTFITPMPLTSQPRPALYFSPRLS